ncbi:MAG: hypothetical protein ACAI43_22190, partial [Phycisphaerae bacterium]
MRLCLDKWGVRLAASVVAVLAVVVRAGAADAPAGGRLPVPPDADVAGAAKVVREVYAADL